MKDHELEILLTEHGKTLNLKQKAFETLERIFFENSKDNDFLCGFDRNEIKTIFDRFEYQIEKRQGVSFISTRIGLYVECPDKVWVDHMEQIGYYELQTDFKGELLDDWFVIEKQKHLKDI